MTEPAEPRDHADRLGELLESIGGVVSFRYRFEPTPGYEYISASCGPLIGYSPDDFYADPDLWQKLVHPDDRERLQAMFMPNASPVTVRWRTREGDWRWAVQSASLVHDGDGRLIAFEGLVFDVTERVRLEEERRRRALELHDEVVQGLAVARMAFDVEDRERLDSSLTSTLESARRLA